jgi:hypothetical protein
MNKIIYILWECHMRLSFKLLFSSIFVVILGLISGCASTGSKLYTYSNVSGVDKGWQGYRELPIYMDASFPKEQRAAFEKVIDEWNYALNGHMHLFVDGSFNKDDEERTAQLIKSIKQTHEGYMILNISHDDEVLEDIIEDDDGTLAFVNGIGMRGRFMVVIKDRIGRKNLHDILLHEFGHLMGAQHFPGTLMNPTYGVGSVPCIDKITMAQVARYWKIDLNKLNYCAVPDFE